MMLVTFGVGLLAVLFTRGAPSVDAFHTILVLAFAIPGASASVNFLNRANEGSIPTYPFRPCEPFADPAPVFYW